MAKNVYREPFDLTTIPDDVLFAESDRRYKERQATEGKYFRMKRVRLCKGCGKPYSARELRSHPCVIAWPRR